MDGPAGRLPAQKMGSGEVCVVCSLQPTRTGSSHQASSTYSHPPFQISSHKPSLPSNRPTSNENMLSIALPPTPKTQDYLPLCIPPCIHSWTDCPLDEVACHCLFKNTFIQTVNTSWCWERCGGEAERVKSDLDRLCVDFAVARWLRPDSRQLLFRLRLRRHGLILRGWRLVLRPPIA